MSLMSQTMSELNFPARTSCATLLTAVLCLWASLVSEVTGEISWQDATVAIPTVQTLELLKKIWQTVSPSALLGNLPLHMPTVHWQGCLTLWVLPLWHNHPWGALRRLGQNFYLYIISEILSSAHWRVWALSVVAYSIVGDYMEERGRGGGHHYVIANWGCTEQKFMICRCCICSCPCTCSWPSFIPDS